MISSITEGEVKEKEAVVFRGYLSSAQTLSINTYTKLNIDAVEFDTNNALTDGKFKPSVAGHYQINGSVNHIGSSVSANTMAVLYKNGAQHLRGTSNIINNTDSAHTSVVSDIIYLDGVDDYVELWGYVRSDGARVGGNTRLNAHLITGQSTGGGTGGGENSIQVKESKTTDFASATGNVFNIDDSKPVQTKGHELLTLDFTPQASDSDIFVDVSVPMSSSTTNIIGYALFMDDEAEALECTWSRISAPNAPSSPILMKHLLPKGITGSHTFKVRYGAYANPGDVSTVQVNGASGTRYLGGALESKITITEFPKGVIGGGSGGSYTPEDMVWENKLPERAEGIIYTNDTGRLLNVSVISKGNIGFSAQLMVNDSVISFFTYDTANHQKTVNAIVPVGATYEFRSGGGTSVISTWTEAKMPLAVSSSSSGGTTDILPVLYSGYITADGTVYKGEGFTCVKGTTGQYIVTLDKPVARTSSVTATVVSSI